MTTSTRRTWRLLPLVLLLGGCMAVGPDYRRPDAPVSADWKQAGLWKPATPQGLDRGDAWWTVFDDPGLDALVAANKIIDSRIVRASQLGKNLQYFYKLEGDTGVKLVTDPRIAPPLAKKDPQAAYVSIPCNLSVQGNLPQLLPVSRSVPKGSWSPRKQSPPVPSV